jgi:hypothetical protein
LLSLDGSRQCVTWFYGGQTPIEDKEATLITFAAVVLPPQVRRAIKRNYADRIMTAMQKVASRENKLRAEQAETGLYKIQEWVLDTAAAVEARSHMRRLRHWMSEDQPPVPLHPHLKLPIATVRRQSGNLMHFGNLVADADVDWSEESTSGSDSASDDDKKPVEDKRDSLRENKATVAARRSAEAAYVEKRDKEHADGKTKPPRAFRPGRRGRLGFAKGTLAEDYRLPRHAHPDSLGFLAAGGFLRFDRSRQRSPGMRPSACSRLIPPIPLPPRRPQSPCNLRA